MLCAPGMRGAMLNILKYCDLFLPSGNELVALTDATDEEGAIEEIFRLGVSEVILKKGSEGCLFFSRDYRIAVPVFPVAEIDPTGAGDCFGATYVACRYLGKSVEASLRYASASGALAVSVLGPMEGRADFAALDAFIEKNRSKGVTYNPLINLRASYDAGKAQGIVSVCSAHPIVIEAALTRAARLRTIALIEAACNQVNQDGGYTGMTPADFRRYVLNIADRVGAVA
ncbi:MAG: PfkB family carbohydrate kinase [Acetobacteraceae bacterium]